jgi:hypothetical protein
MTAKFLFQVNCTRPTSTTECHPLFRRAALHHRRSTEYSYPSLLGRAPMPCGVARLALTLWGTRGLTRAEGGPWHGLPVWGGLSLRLSDVSNNNNLSGTQQPMDPVTVTRSYRAHWVHSRRDCATCRVVVFSSASGLVQLRQASPGLGLHLCQKPLH